MLSVIYLNRQWWLQLASGDIAGPYLSLQQASEAEREERLIMLIETEERSAPVEAPEEWDETFPEEVVQ